MPNALSTSEEAPSRQPKPLDPQLRAGQADSTEDCIERSGSAAGDPSAREGSHRAQYSSPLHSALLSGAAVAALIVVHGTAGSGSSIFASNAELMLATAFLGAACYSDLRWRKIPNLLNLAAIIGLVLIVSFGFATSEPGFSRVLGGLIAFGFLVPLFALGGVGAGDVKAAAVMGAFWGTGQVLAGLLASFMVGGVIAIAMVVLAGQFRDLLSRWWATLRLSIRAGRIHYFPPEEIEGPPRGVPFAIAMTGAAIWLGV